MKNIQHIDSPALLVFPEKVKHNIHEMIHMVNGDVNRLRPHIKTHKTHEGIRLMMDAGIYKFKCATIAEAELLALNNVKDVLIAHQPTSQKLERIVQLIRNYPQTKFSILIDNVETANSISSALKKESLKLDVFVDINVGMNRTGILPGVQAVRLVDEIAKLPSLQFIGLHVYDGQHRQANFTEREDACFYAFQPVYGLIEMLKLSGHSCPTIVAGGTPTFSIHCKHTDRECSPGTHIFWDHGYGTICQEQNFVPAVHVLTRVISIPDTNRICLDLGHKAIASENEISKRIYFPQHPDLKPVSQSEEHLVMETQGDHSFKVGDELIGIPYHICPTVALHESLYAVENDQVIGEWKVEARKRKINY